MMIAVPADNTALYLSACGMRNLEWQQQTSMHKLEAYSKSFTHSRSLSGSKQVQTMGMLLLLLRTHAAIIGAQV